MKNVIIPGARGNVAKHFIDILVKKDASKFTLFFRGLSAMSSTGINGTPTFDFLNLAV